MNIAFFFLLTVLFSNPERFSNETEGRPIELSQLFSTLLPDGLYIDKPIYYPTCKASAQNKFSLKYVEVSSRKKLITSLGRAARDSHVDRQNCLCYSLFPIKTFKCNWI